MPTITELKKLAKDNNVYISSRANKGDIEDALYKANIPFEASAPRKAATPKTMAVAAPVASVAYKPGALVEVVTIEEDRSARVHYLPVTSIPDLNKLKAQMKLPLDQREVDEDLNVDYVEVLLEKAKHVIEGNDGFEPTGDEHIVYSANVRMYL
jgi:hypothetical protein